MKKVLISLSASGAFAWCAMYGVFAIGEQSIGSPMSAAEAATLSGGCTGAASVACPGGTYCGTGTYVTLGNGTLADGTGSKNCGGVSDCALAYLGTKACVGS